MPKLKCDVKKCVYNCERLCAKSVIYVNNDVDAKKCESFDERRYEKNDYNTEFANMDNTNLYVSIECKAKECDYNNNGTCVSENVKIGCGGIKCENKAECETFSA